MQVDDQPEDFMAGLQSVGGQPTLSGHPPEVVTALERWLRILRVPENARFPNLAVLPLPHLDLMLSDPEQVPQRLQHGDLAHLAAQVQADAGAAPGHAGGWLDLEEAAT